MTNLQELLFPGEVCPERELYYRYDGPGDGPGPIRLEKGESISAETFFNSFSIGKWRRYTHLDNLSLELELSGAFTVQLLHLTGGAGEGVASVVLSEHAFRASERRSFEAAYPDELAEEGLYAWRLTLTGASGAFYGGRYRTRIDEAGLNPVDIAVDICTYRREAFVERNLELMRRAIIDNPDSPMHGHLEVFISDNGQTLDIHRLQGDSIHIFRNRNAGGAGGFARGMIEVMDSPRDFSHVLLMDDDILLTGDTLLRTWCFLRFLKPEFASKTVAGALMRLDRRYVQYENGALWDGLEPRPLKVNLDMRRVENLLENEREEPVDYNGWWYSCVPIQKIRGDNLPLPLFVHRDDVEFALRTGSEILTLNGACVWHESFDNRYSSSVVYYETRNDLILNALNRPGFSGIAAAKLVARKLIVNVIRYRYDDCDRVLKGVNDFCAGAGFLMNADPEALNRKVMEHAYRFEPLEGLEIPFDEAKYLESLEKGKSKIVMLRVLFLNGLFLPAKGTNVVNAATCWPRNCYRKKALLNYDRTTGKGFVTKRSIRRSLSAILRMCLSALKLVIRYPAAAASYRAAQPEMTSRAFWDSYLGLK